MSDIPMRSWYATGEFPGLKPFRFGNIMVTHNAPYHEVEQAAARKLEQHLPPGWRITDLRPGAVWVVPEEAEAKT